MGSAWKPSGSRTTKLAVSSVLSIPTYLHLPCGHVLMSGRRFSHCAVKDSRLNNTKPARSDLARNFGREIVYHTVHENSSSLHYASGCSVARPRALRAKQY